MNWTEHFPFSANFDLYTIETHGKKLVLLRANIAKKMFREISKFAKSK